MALVESLYGDNGNKVRYEGCVIRTWEHNGYDDSDWYAEVWDEESQSVKVIEYATTRAGGSGWAEMDATWDTIRKVYRFYKKEVTELFDGRYNETDAKKVLKGDEVIVVKGRKVKKGTIGKAFWIGTRYNSYSRCNEERIGIEVNGERIFLALENVEVLDWKSRLLTGKNRKEKIQAMARNRIPAWYRQYVDAEWVAKHLKKAA